MLSVKWEKRWDWRKKWMGPLCVIRKMARILGGSAFLLSAWTRLENFPILVSQSEKTKCWLAASWWRKWFPRCHDKKRNKSTSCAAVEFSSGRSIVWWVGHIFHHGGGHWLQNWNAFSFKIRFYGWMIYYSTRQNVENHIDKDISMKTTTQIRGFRFID